MTDSVLHNHTLYTGCLSIHSRGSLLAPRRQTLLVQRGVFFTVNVVFCLWNTFIVLLRRCCVDTLYWVIGATAVLVFGLGFYIEVLVKRRGTRLKVLRVRRIACRLRNTTFAGYNPFEIVREVASQANIAPPELLVINSGYPLAFIFSTGKKAVIVCSKLLLATTTEKEFEGVVAHEIAHLFIDVLFWGTRYCFTAFSLCGIFLFSECTSLLFWEALTPRASSIFTSAPVAVVVLFSASLCAFLLALACPAVRKILEKKREFNADTKALSFTRYPWELVDHLAHFSASDTQMMERALAAKRILLKRGVKR